MRKNSTELTWLIAGLGFFWLASFKRFRKNMKFKVSKVDFNLKKSLNDLMRKLYFDLTAVVENPTDFNLELKSLTFKFYYKNLLIGYAVKSGPVVIAPNSKDDVVFNLEVRTAPALQSFPDIIKELTEAKSEILIKGEIFSEAGTLTISQSIPLKILSNV